MHLVFTHCVNVDHRSIPERRSVGSVGTMRVSSEEPGDIHMFSGVSLAQLDPAPD
jgi:hypothetical protein